MIEQPRICGVNIPKVAGLTDLLINFHRKIKDLNSVPLRTSTGRVDWYNLAKKIVLFVAAIFVYPTLIGAILLTNKLSCFFPKPKIPANSLLSVSGFAQETNDAIDTIEIDLKIYKKIGILFSITLDSVDYVETVQLDSLDTFKSWSQRIKHQVSEKLVDTSIKQIVLSKITIVSVEPLVSRYKLELEGSKIICTRDRGLSNVSYTEICDDLSSEKAKSLLKDLLVPSNHLS